MISNYYTGIHGESPLLQPTIERIHDFQKTYLHFDTLFVKYIQKSIKRGKYEFRLLPKTYKTRTENK